MAPRWIAAKELCMKSDLPGHQRNYIARSYRPRLEDGRVEPAHAPAWGRGVTLFDTLVVDVVLELLAVDVELSTRSARLSDFESGAAGTELIADAHVTEVDAADGEVFAKRAVEQRVTSDG